MASKSSRHVASSPTLSERVLGARDERTRVVVSKGERPCLLKKLKRAGELCGVAGVSAQQPLDLVVHRRVFKGMYCYKACALPSVMSLR